MTWILRRSFLPRLRMKCVVALSDNKKIVVRGRCICRKSHPLSATKILMQSPVPPLIPKSILARAESVLPQQLREKQVVFQPTFLCVIGRRDETMRYLRKIPGKSLCVSFWGWEVLRTDILVTRGTQIVTKRTRIFRWEKVYEPFVWMSVIGSFVITRRLDHINYVPFETLRILGLLAPMITLMTASLSTNTPNSKRLWDMLMSGDTWSISRSNCGCWRVKSKPFHSQSRVQRDYCCLCGCEKMLFAFLHIHEIARMLITSNVQDTTSSWFWILEVSCNGSVLEQTQLAKSAWSPTSELSMMLFELDGSKQSCQSLVASFVPLRDCSCECVDGPQNVKRPVLVKWKSVNKICAQTGSTFTNYLKKWTANGGRQCTASPPSFDEAQISLLIHCKDNTSNDPLSQCKSVQ